MSVESRMRSLEYSEADAGTKRAERVKTSDSSHSPEVKFDHPVLGKIHNLFREIFTKPEGLDPRFGKVAIAREHRLSAHSDALEVEWGKLVYKRKIGSVQRVRLALSMSIPVEDYYVLVISYETRDGVRGIAIFNGHSAKNGNSISYDWLPLQENSGLTESLLDAIAEAIDTAKRKVIRLRMG